MTAHPDAGLKTCEILRVGGAEAGVVSDVLAVEEPLEIQVACGPAAARRRHSIAVTMRTPGHDFDLAMGFLFTESIIARAEEVTLLRYVQQPSEAAAPSNVLLAELRPDVQVSEQLLSRHFYTTSSCGICGKASIDLVNLHTCFSLLPKEPVVPAEILHQLPQVLAGQQDVFSHTGGLHAAGLFDARGRLLLLREDVGRHNAVDKLIGAALQQGQVPLSQHLLLVSGRAGFELGQKALMAGIPMLAAVGAPSSLCVELAEAYGMTLIGFLRNGRFNVYSGRQRVSA